MRSRYALDRPDDEWRATVLQRATPLFGDCTLVVLFIANVTPSRVALEHIEVPGGPEQRLTQQPSEPPDGDGRERDEGSTAARHYR